MKPTREQVLTEPAGRQMDAWVAEHVLRDPFVKPMHGTCCTCQVCGHGHDDCLCGLSEEIADAWTAVEHIHELLSDGTSPLFVPDYNFLTLTCTGNTTGYVASFASCLGDEWWEDWQDYQATAPGDTPALAICRAALLAVLDAQP